MARFIKKKSTSANNLIYLRSRNNATNEFILSVINNFLFLFKQNHTPLPIYEHQLQLPLALKKRNFCAYDALHVRSLYDDQSNGALQFGLLHGRPDLQCRTKIR